MLLSVRSRSRDRALLIGAWITMLGLLGLFIPWKNIRQAIVPFFFMQFLTWLFGLIVVERKLITYPNRLVFRKTNKASFTFEFFIFPATCALFNLYYPKSKDMKKKLSYYAAYIFTLTGLETFAENYTNTIDYLKWKWHYSFVSMWLFFFVSRKYTQWFFKTEPIPNSRKQGEKDSNILSK